MKTKFKLLALIFACLSMAILLMPNQVLATNVTEVANLAELQAALADENVTGEIKLTEIIKIEESVTINGNNKTITTSKSKAFEVHTGTAEFKNLTIINSAANGRCVDVRDGDVELTLDNVNLKATAKSHNQPLTIGSTFTQTAPINIKNTTIEAGPDGWGYAVIVFNPVNLNIENSDIIGYAALYMKAEINPLTGQSTNSTGTTGSSITINDSVLTGKYELATNEPSNSFATIVLDDTGINMDINNSELKAIGAIQKIIGEHKDVILSDKSSEVSISGNSVISTQQVIASMIDPDATVIINEGVTSNIEIPEALLPTGAVAKQENGNYVVYVPHDVVINEVEGGTVTVDKTSAIAGETITITAKEDLNYELKSLKVYTAAETEIEVVDGKFVMPNLGAIVVAEFEKIIPPMDYIISGEETENNIGVVESEKVVETLDTSLKADTELNKKVEEERQNGNQVTIEIVVEELEKENINEEEKQKILQTVAANQTVHQYFDISVLVRTNETELGKLTQLTEKMKFSMEISQDLIQEGRKFYILKVHGDEVERIEAVLNGTKLEFETSQFSTFALAYEDVVEENKAETPAEGEKDDTPKTGVINIPAYVWVSIAGMAIIGILTTKKPSKHSK